MYPEEYFDLVSTEKEEICAGGSIIVSPLGKIIAGPLFGESGCLIAELDLDDIQDSKLDFDVIGHYARNDIFQLVIQDQPKMINEDNCLLKSFSDYFLF